MAHRTQPDGSMSTARTIAELARQVRADTLRRLEEADELLLTRWARGTANHILWHAGHALWLGDVLGVGLLTRRSELPAGWAEMFGMGSDPEASRQRAPSREELQRLLRS